MKVSGHYIILSLLLMIMSSCNKEGKLAVMIFETSEAGKKLDRISEKEIEAADISIQILKDQKYQTILGFGGSFTESGAFLIKQLSEENRSKILNAYFGEDGARYSLTRTHINSCDFSLKNYSYANIAGDLNLATFSVDEDKDDLIPMIQEAMRISKEGFKIISSP